MNIVPIIGALPHDLGELRPFAAAEGINTIARIREEWDTGELRFDSPGELLLSVRAGVTLIGVGGISRDENHPGALRMRRFYVHPDRRRSGAGTCMAEWLLRHARLHTALVTLRAGSGGAARFWERMGFVAVGLETHTHEWRF